MGQEEVLKALKKSKRPLTSTEISRIIDIGSRSVRRVLKGLQADCSVKLETKKLNKQQTINMYGRPLKIKVYFLKK